MGLVPSYGIRRELERARKGSVHGLVALRAIFVHLTTMAVLAGALLAVVIATSNKNSRSSGEVIAACIAVVVLSSASLVAGARMSQKLDCASDTSLARTYVAGFMLRLAFANLCIIIGVLGAQFANEWWLVLLGAFFTTLGLARLAPTYSRMRLEQVELNTTGCNRDLVAALTVLPPQQPRTR
jgi:multisubunit Na+/H+ antiporter MnhG subunit